MTDLLTEPEEPDGIAREYLSDHTAAVVVVRMVFDLPNGRRYVSELPVTPSLLSDADPLILDRLVAHVRYTQFPSVGDFPCTIQLLIPEQHR